jgi:hypothetical protein
MRDIDKKCSYSKGYYAAIHHVLGNNQCYSSPSKMEHDSVK